MISREEAIKIAETKHGLGFELYSVSHGLPDNCFIYGSGKWTPDHTWCVLCCAHPGKVMLASSRAIVICKDTGNILYDGSAGDEG